MFAVRRWWGQYARRAGLMVLAVGTAWLIRETQGAAIYETYQWLTRPLQPGLTNADRLDNAYVLELQKRIVELENQNQTLESLVDYQGTLSEPGIVSAVIGRSADHWWQQVVLGKGSNAGIKVGYVVTGPGGLVGRVISVTSNTSRVLLISDSSSRVGVTISRSRSMGYMRGQAGNQVVMEFFDKSPDVKVGDVVATSSYSRLFPSDIPIGRIESVDVSKSPAPQAVIQLSAPISILEWVTVQPFIPLEDVDGPPVELVPEGEP